jgi:MFS family permease
VVDSYRSSVSNTAPATAEEANNANRWATGAITGPMIGETLAEHNQFRWLFWINVPLGAGSLAILTFAAQPESERAGPILPKLLSFDWLGLVLLSGSMVSLLLGLTRVSRIMSENLGS